METPREVGGYELLGALGRGGMGAVYRARDGEGRVVALKLLHAYLDADPESRERLRREVRNLQRVRHPGVARVLDAELDSAEAFIVTELVAGQDLRERVRTGGQLDAAELADLAASLHEALEVVHRAGVLHRDLTPGNVMLTDDGPVLIDFGIAQSADDARVTSTGLVAGTPGYVAPELLAGAEPAVASDWWGWAALLAFAATGRPPFGEGPGVLARVRAGAADLAGLDRRTAAALGGALLAEPWHRIPPERVVEDLVLARDGVDLEVGTEVLGGTRVLPVEDWFGEEREPAVVPEVPVPRRSGTMLAFGLALAAVGALRPVVALFVLAVAVVLVRSVGLDLAAVHRRRLRRGERRSDPALATVAWPYYLVRAAIGAVPALVVGGAVVVLVGSAGWLLLQRYQLPPPLGEQGGWNLLLAVAVFAGALGAWFGPLGRGTRLGGRWLVGVAAPGRSGALAMVILVVGGLTVLAFLAGTEIGWWPLSGSPFPEP